MSNGNNCGRLRAPVPAFVGMVLAVGIYAAAQAEEKPAPDEQASTAPAASVDEARARARLLHETLHATLHAVHHHYYREDEGLPIPAATLDKVFGQIARRQNVQLHWLAVDGQAMNTDNVARDDFERAAVKAIASGKLEHESIDGKTYRLAGAITLTGDCLKCHIPNRTSTEDRAAGLVIGIPLRETHKP